MGGLYIVSLNEKLDLRTTPPRLYTVMEVSDGTRTAFLPFGAEVHAQLVTAFPALFRQARHAAPAAAEPTPPAADAPGEAFPGLDGEVHLGLPAEEMVAAHYAVQEEAVDEGGDGDEPDASDAAPVPEFRTRRGGR
jgi:hypothetical protein